MTPSELRKAFGLSKSEIGQLTGLTREEWKSIETGQSELPDPARHWMDYILPYLDLREPSERQAELHRRLQDEISGSMNDMLARNEFKIFLLAAKIESRKNVVRNDARRRIVFYAMPPLTSAKELGNKILEAVSDQILMTDFRLIELERDIDVLKRITAFLKSELKNNKGLNKPEKVKH